MTDNRDNDPIDGDEPDLIDDAGQAVKGFSRRRVLKGLAAGTAAAAGGLAAASSLSPGTIETVGSDGATGSGAATGNSGSSTAESLAVSTGADGVSGGPATTTPSGTVLVESAPSTSVVADAPIAAQETLVGAEIATAAAVEQRILVVIELQGGSDGLSLVVPDDPNYRNARGGDLTITPATYHALDGKVGLHPSLVEVAKRGVTTVEGVGLIDGNLSHFKMAASWERGDVNSSKLVSSGFCGRLADAVNRSDGFAGVSVAGRTGYFGGGRVPALVVSEATELNLITSEAEAGFRLAAQGFTDPVGSNWVKLSDMGQKLRTGLANPPDNTMIRRGKDLGKQLFLAAQLIKAEVGVKVLYANLGSFDTHDNQERRLRFLWEEFDFAVAGFYQMLEEAGMANRVLVATTSEFGRRLKRNARGTDHGSATNLMMIGPITPARLGAYPSLTSTDSDGNLKTEVPFDRYYATLCKDWMGVEPSLVLPGDPAPLGLA